MYEVGNIGGKKSHGFTRDCNQVYYTETSWIFALLSRSRSRVHRHIFIVFSLTMNEPLVLPPVPDSLLISANITLF